MMRLILLSSPLLSAAALAAQPTSCPQPQMQLAPLIVQDDGRDRGYPGGLSLGDLDGDGDLDLLATRGYDPTAKSYKGDRSLLYLNDGHGAFTRQESPWSDEEAPDSGATLADVDGDGDLDAYVNTQLKKPNRYFRNEGGGRFVAAELGEATQDKSSNFSSSFADIDGDGDLDLYVSGPTLELNDVNLVFRNDRGRFVAVTGAAIDNGKNNPAAALWADVDNDGDLDLFVANSDVMRLSKYPAPPIEHSMLYRNDHNWNFTADKQQAFAHPAYPAISAALGDIDNDGDLDLFLGSHVYQVEPRPDWLFINDGKGRFALSAQTFPTHTETATGAAFADFNGDGNLDLLATSYEGPVELFTGDGAGNFTLVQDPALAEARKGRWAAVTGDIDGDGRIDALLGSWGETTQGDYITIVRNRTPRCGSWAELVVKDRAGAPNPPGTRVTLTTQAGGRTLQQMRESNAQSGFRSQSASTFLFAIPPGHRVRDVEVRWPDGRVQRVKQIKAGSRTILSYS
jgi:enediyne biosynthesis protein E4